MNKIWLVTFIILTSCAGSGGTKHGGKYTSPFANFTCGPFELDTSAQEAFGPHGGTVRFADDVENLRVDVEEFQPVLDKNTLMNTLERLYQGYFAQNTMPLIRKGIPNASLIKEGMIKIDGVAVYQVAVLTPGNSPAVDGTGKRIDGIRGLIQYTNGQYMYTVTEYGIAWPDRSREEQVALTLKNAEDSFKRCSFPK